MPGASLKIFHCADLHLGLRFTRYPDEISEKLREARFSTLEQMVARANEAGCELFVVAGDLFDTLKVAQRDVARAAKILARFDRVVAVLPGNHDFHAGAADDFWKHFDRPDHGRLILMEDARAYSLQDLGVDAVLYAAPCGSKYSATHALAWLEGAERPSAAFHVGIAHGSFEGLSPDLQGNYFPMKADDLLRCRLQLWLLGHIHVPFPPKPGSGDKIYYSGTHEPDGFDCRHEGRSWILDLAADGAVRAEAVSTGQFRFREVELELRSLAQLREVGERFASEAPRTLLKLTLRGSLSREEYGRFAEALAELQGRFFYVKSDFSALRVALTAADIDREFARESFPHRLLRELSLEDPEGAALQAAFEILREAQGGHA